MTAARLVSNRNPCSRGDGQHWAYMGQGGSSVVDYFVTTAMKMQNRRKSRGIPAMLVTVLVMFFVVAVAMLLWSL